MCYLNLRADSARAHVRNTQARHTHTMRIAHAGHAPLDRSIPSIPAAEAQEMCAPVDELTKPYKSHWLTVTDTCRRIAQLSPTRQTKWIDTFQARRKISL